MARTAKRPTPDRIVDTALQLAEQGGWESLRLHQLATECGIGLDDIRRHFREKDDIIDAWFDRADAAMLRHFDQGRVDGLPPRERIRHLIVAWLQALAPHQQVTREMIRHKMEFGHVHVQFPAVLRISRTVQWIREGATLDAPLPRRALEETAMTTLFVKTFLRWLRDDSPAFERTRRRLDRDLYLLETAARLIPGGRFSGAPAPTSDTATGAGDDREPGNRSESGAPRPH